jgi:hypothetical protein
MSVEKTIAGATMKVQHQDGWATWSVTRNDVGLVGSGEEARFQDALREATDLAINFNAAILAY